MSLDNLKSILSRILDNDSPEFHFLTAYYIPSLFYLKIIDPFRYTKTLVAYLIMYSFEANVRVRIAFLSISKRVSESKDENKGSITSSYISTFTLDPFRSCPNYPELLGNRDSLCNCN